MIQCQFVIIYSVLEEKNISRGTRLRKNENLIDTVAYEGKLISLVRLVMDMRMGIVSRIRIVRIEDVGMLITLIWICTKVFGS